MSSTSSRSLAEAAARSASERARDRAERRRVRAPPRAYGVTYWHLVTTDHVNFFTPDEIRDLATRIGADADVRLAEPLEACALVPERRLWWYALVLLARARLLRPAGWARIYAELTPRDR